MTFESNISSAFERVAAEINAVRAEAGAVHIQSTPSDVWLTTYDLPHRPSVTIVDSAGSIVEGSITYIGSDQIEVRFSGGFSGAAYLR